MTAIITSMTTVFTEIMSWIMTAINAVIPVFWNSTDSELTFLGVLAIMALAISIFFLLVATSICPSALF